MFTAWQTQFAKPAATAAGNFGDLVQPIQQVSGSGTVTAPGAIIGSGFSKSSTVPAGGAMLALYTNGEGYTNDDGTWEWWIPATANKGNSYWAELVALSGLGTMSGSPLSTRVQISGGPSWSLDQVGKLRTFTLNFYDAASGGSLVSTGTITLDTIP